MTGKISEMPAASTPLTKNELLELIQNGINVKVPLSTILNSIDINSLKTSIIASLTTDDITEGTNNLFYTTARDDSELLLIIKTITDNYIINSSDKVRTLIRSEATSAVSITVPFDDGSLPIPFGSCILVGKAGAGDITIVPANNQVILNTSSGLSITKLHGKATLIYVALNTWDIDGNLF